MKNKVSFNSVTYTAIFLAGALNYSILLGTIEKVLDEIPLLVAIDMLRMDSSLFIAIGFLAACVLFPSDKYLKLRRLLVIVLCPTILAFAIASSALLQWTSEAGPMSKVSFYVNYLGYSWFDDAVFKILVLFVIPVFLICLAGFVYWVCIEHDENERTNKRRYQVYVAIVSFSLLQGCFLPVQNSLPSSLSYNSILYFLKSGYMPKHGFYDYSDRSSASYGEWEFSSRSNEEQNKKNVVFILLESWRYDAGDLEGGLTPFLAKFSEDSYVFDRAYVTVPHTSKAMVGIHCGIFPYLDLPIFESVLGVPVKCLPELLSEQAYKTAFFQSPTAYYENRQDLVEVLGFQDFFSAESFKDSDFSRVNLLSFEDRVMLEPAGRWLEEHKQAPFMMSFLTGVTHRGYRPPEYFIKRLYVESTMRNNYLNAVNYTDQFLEELLNIFKDAGVYEDTIFVFVSDHGEGFSEHGMNMHNNIPYEEVSHIFMMIHDPSKKELNHRNDRVVSQTQLLPTVFDILGYEQQNNALPKSVFKQQGKAISSCYEGLICSVLIEHKYKYIYNFDEKAPELYDLQSDPAETDNLAEQEPQIVAKMHRELIDWQQQHQTIYHRFYSEQDAGYQSNIKDTVITTIFDMYESLDEIWPDGK